MSHIVNKSSRRRIIVLLLALFFLFSILPSRSILWTPTLRPTPGHKEQTDDQITFEEPPDDQIAFEGNISSPGTDFMWPERAQKVKDAFVHAYAGYKTYAFGMDELKPVSNGGVNK